MKNWFKSQITFIRNEEQIRMYKANPNNQVKVNNDDDDLWK